ncbi:hypothetical protein U9M48_044477 [Paspalum notatum var. saurae]|uniref:Uncharacterized protein n=1 Tax=Paspalum notatum var. saurae TaxID=547442 RepID=A0AAQ3XIA8_PASNO
MLLGISRRSDQRRSWQVQISVRNNALSLLTFHGLPSPSRTFSAPTSSPSHRTPPSHPPRQSPATRLAGAPSLASWSPTSPERGGKEPPRPDPAPAVRAEEEEVVGMRGGWRRVARRRAGGGVAWPRRRGAHGSAARRVASVGGRAWRGRRPRPAS